MHFPSRNLAVLAEQRRSLKQVISMTQARFEATGNAEYRTTASALIKMLADLDAQKADLDAQNMHALREMAMRPGFEYLQSYIDAQDIEDRRDAAL